jgi:hypothetical protein
VTGRSIRSPSRTWYHFHNIFSPPSRSPQSRSPSGCVCPYRQCRCVMTSSASRIRHPRGYRSASATLWSSGAYKSGPLQGRACDDRRTTTIPTAERMKRHWNWNRHIYADHAHLDLVGELACGIAITREDGGSVSKFMFVDPFSGGRPDEPRSTSTCNLEEIPIPVQLCPSERSLR